MKKFIAIAAVLAVISAVSVNASAVVIPDSVYANSVAPLYETAPDAISTLTIRGKTAKCESKLIGHSDVKSCKVVQTLEKKWGLWIWNEVDGASWNHIISGSSGTYDCSTGKLIYTYVAYTEEDGVIIDNVFELEV